MNAKICDVCKYTFKLLSYFFFRYLQENLIKKMENMEELTCLYSLNLTDNCIETISGLCTLSTI